MRLFVALYPPPEVLDDIFAEVARLRVGQAAASGVNVRLVDRVTAHITLAFLGDVDEERLPEVEAALGRAARPARHAARVHDELPVGTDPLRAAGPPRLRITGGGQFGEGRLAVLWAGVGGEVTALHVLAGNIRSELRRARLPYDERPFRPHFSLARPGGQLDPAAIEQDRSTLDAYRGPSWPATEMVLVRSHPGPRPLYDRLTGWPL